jgi:hypothetical protein
MSISFLLSTSRSSSPSFRNWKMSLKWRSRLNRSPVRRASGRGCCLARDLPSPRIFPPRGGRSDFSPDNASRSSVHNSLARSVRLWMRRALHASARTGVSGRRRRVAAGLQGTEPTSDGRLLEPATGVFPPSPSLGWLRGAHSGEHRGTVSVLANIGCG